MPLFSRDNLAADNFFKLYLGMLLVLGIIFLSFASTPAGYAKYNDAYYLVKNQFIFGLLPGLALAVVISKMSYDFWRKLAWPLYLLALGLLMLVFIPGVGVMINNARSWIMIFGHTFQPAELVKLAVIILLAALLADKRRDLSDWKNGLLPVLLVIAPAGILILLQPDVGTLSILTVIIFFMLYLAKVPKSYLVILALLGVVCLGGLILLKPYRLNRMTIFLHPELDPQGIGYHTNQAFLAIGSGGFWGRGLGQSRQKFQYLPEAWSDSVYAVIAEENGFLISAGLVILFLLLGWRGLRIARAASDDFGRLLAAGIMVWLLWQTFVNIGAMVGIMPLTGVPLPFVSHGGSALLVMLAAMGVVLSVSRQCQLNNSKV
jgi:cell division protein FtsW